MIAGRSWEDKMTKMQIPEAVEGSWEDLLHRVDGKNKLLILDQWKNDPLFEYPIEHRAIGVVYHPELDEKNNYVPSIIPKRYDAFIYLDETEALHPLHIHPDALQMPETYPWGD